MRRIITLMAIATLTTLSGCERYKLDRQMEELCKKDGGIKVYETVTLSPVEYDDVFNYVTKHKTQEDYYGTAYRYVFKKEVLIGKSANPERGDGRLTRFYEAIYRRADNFLLGEQIEYSRGGGDFFTFGFQPSADYCPKPRVSLQTAVFVKGE